MSSKIEKLAELTGKTTSAKAAKTSAPKGKTSAPKTDAPKGFTAKAMQALRAKAKAVLADYRRGVGSGRIPTVRQASKRVYPMQIVAWAWGWTSNADANAKLQAVCDVLGVAGPNGVNWGLMDYASESFLKRQKCMGGALAKAYRATADKSGVYHMTPTGRVERAKADTLTGNGKLTGDKPTAKTATKGKAATAPKRDPERSNGSVKVTVDKAIRSAAQAAERNAQRAANRAKVAAEREAAQARKVAEADIANA